MIEVIPAIIPKSFFDLKEKMSQMLGLVPLVQVDVLDGKFTPDKSWPYMREPDPDFFKIISEEKGFPFWEKIEFEVDLMVADVEAVADQWVLAGARRVIFHFESFPSAQEVLAAIRQFREKFSVSDTPFSVEVGIASNVDTANEKIYSLVEDVDFVQFMGIAKIGYQGQPFDDRVLEKISDLRSKYRDVIISIDGGVNFNSAPLLVEAGVNRLVAGSAIFQSEDSATAIETLKTS